MGRAYTNAPEVYDYAYTSTLITLTSVRAFLLLEPPPGWRVVEYSDEDRFRRYQTPRYGSGLYATIELDSPEAESIGLPSSAKLDEMLAPAPAVEEEEDLSEYDHGPLEEACDLCGEELHATHGEYGQGNDDITYPSWRLVFDHVAEELECEEGVMVCRECLENGTDFKFSVDCLENGEGDEHNAKGGV